MLFPFVFAEAAEKEKINSCFSASLVLLWSGRTVVCCCCSFVSFLSVVFPFIFGFSAAPCAGCRCLLVCCGDEGDLGEFGEISSHPKSLAASCELGVCCAPGLSGF
jgi:hypothetical protein